MHFEITITTKVEGEESRVTFCGLPLYFSTNDTCDWVSQDGEEYVLVFIPVGTEDAVMDPSEGTIDGENSLPTTVTGLPDAGVLIQVNAIGGPTVPIKNPADPRVYS